MSQADEQRRIFADELWQMLERKDAKWDDSILECVLVLVAGRYFDILADQTDVFQRKDKLEVVIYFKVFFSNRKV